MRSRNALDYLRARVFRIFPALWVMLVFSVFVLGAGFSRLEFFSYLSEPLTWRYFLKNAVLMGGLEYYLPSMFEHNHLKGVMNGSLWSKLITIYCFDGLSVFPWMNPYGIILHLQQTGTGCSTPK